MISHNSDAIMTLIMMSKLIFFGRSLHLSSKNEC